MLSLNGSTNLLLSQNIGTMASLPTVGADKSSQSLNEVIDQLAQTLTKDGHLDKESPLGQMVGERMHKMNPMAALIGGTPHMIKAALGDLIKDKLGDNFGAAADAGQTSAGAPNLMTQTLNGLAKASLDDLLTKQGEGTTFSKGDMPLLKCIAEFMDQRTAQNSLKYPAPDSGSWSNELKEDSFLDGKETAAFRSALDSLGTQLNQQQGGLGDAGGGSPLGNPVSRLSPSIPSGADHASAGGLSQDLGQLLSNLLQKGVNTSVDGGLGTPVNNASQWAGANGNVTRDLGQLLSGLISKGLDAELNGASVKGTGGQHNPFDQHDHQNMLAHAASTLVLAFVGSDKTSNGLS
jgi:hypothetical protein